MGRKGVEVREKSIRVLFTYDGKLQRPTLMRDGEALPPTPANQKYAHRLVEEIRERVRHGTFRMADYFSVAGGSVGATSLADVLDTWLAAQRIAHSTKLGYESIIKFWKAALDGERAARSIKHSEILTAIADRPELSGKTINNNVSVLREAFALALVDKVVDTSPVDGVPRAKYQKPEADPFSLEEAEAIIAHSAKSHPPAVHNLIEHWFFSGYRTGEIAGLKWPSVDFRREEVQVHETIVRGLEKAKTKTDVARLVKLNSRALAALKRQKAHTFLANEHVFLDPRYGTPWSDERAFRRSYWVPTLKALGIRYRRPYNMRHTYATMMLMAGMKPARCAKQMGHSVEVFLNTYTKWLPGDEDDREMALLEKFIAPAPLQKDGTT